MGLGGINTDSIFDDISYDDLSVKLNKTNDSKDKNTGRKENENSESIEQK